MCERGTQQTGVLENIAQLLANLLGKVKLGCIWRFGLVCRKTINGQVVFPRRRGVAVIVNEDSDCLDSPIKSVFTGSRQ